MENIGRNIKELRLRKRLTQKMLAEKLECTQQTVFAWETDVCYPKLETLVKMKDIFGVSIDTILCAKLEVVYV